MVQRRDETSSCRREMVACRQDRHRREHAALQSADGYLECERHSASHDIFPRGLFIVLLTYPVCVHSAVPQAPTPFKAKRSWHERLFNAVRGNSYEESVTTRSRQRKLAIGGRGNALDSYVQMRMAIARVVCSLSAVD